MKRLFLQAPQRPDALAHGNTRRHSKQSTGSNKDVPSGDFSLTSSRVLIRFIGNAFHPSDYERLDAWVPRLKLWLEDGLQELDFCAHQPNNVLAPELARAFVERMNAQAGTRLRSWVPMDQGTQLGLFG